MKYISKPSTVMAVKIDGKLWSLNNEIYIPNAKELSAELDKFPYWFRRAFHDREIAVDYNVCKRTYEMFVLVPEGSIQVNSGDYIVKGVDGKIYPYNPEKFHSKYEPCLKSSLVEVTVECLRPVTVICPSCEIPFETHQMVGRDNKPKEKFAFCYDCKKQINESEWKQCGESLKIAKQRKALDVLLQSSLSSLLGFLIEDMEPSDIRMSSSAMDFFVSEIEREIKHRISGKLISECNARIFISPENKVYVFVGKVQKEEEALFHHHLINLII